VRLLLGTDAYSALKRGHTLAAELVRRSDEVLLSTVAAGVLLHGIRCRKSFRAHPAGLTSHREHRP